MQITPKEPKLLGCGTYGCVYYPPYPSTNSEKTKKYSNYVMKIQDASYKVCMREQDIINKLKKIDPDQNNFIYFSDSSIIPIPYDKCSGCSRLIEHPVGYYMRHGGHTLEYMGKNRPVFFLENISKWLLDILEAIEILQKNKISHSDIKADNILIDPTDNRARLIDFNLSFIYGEFNTRPIINSFYEIMPPFINLLSDETKEVGINEFITWSYRKYDKLNNIESINLLVNKYTMLGPYKFMKYAKDLVHLIDVFSLGLSFLSVIKNYKLTNKIRPELDSLLNSMANLSPELQYNSAQSISVIKTQLN